MAAVTTCSDFGAQENKVCHYFHFFPIYLPRSDGTGYHDLSFLNVESKASAEKENELASQANKRKLLKGNERVALEKNQPLPFWWVPLMPSQQETGSPQGWLVYLYPAAGVRRSVLRKLKVFNGRVVT